MSKKYADDLSEDAVQEFKEAFILFDADGGGEIDEEELGEVLASLGQELTPEEVHEMMVKVDTDGGGSIDFDEFLEMMAELLANKGTDESDYVEAFKILDKDGSGAISAEELYYIATHLGEKATDEEIQELIRSGDVDGDGQIGYDEVSSKLAGRLPQLGDFLAANERIST